MGQIEFKVNSGSTEILGINAYANDSAKIGIKLDKTMRAAILNGNNPKKIIISSGDAHQEPTLLQYRGKTLLYFTEGISGANTSGEHEWIDVCDYDIETNTVSNISRCVDSTILSDTTKWRSVKCSQFFVYNGCVYGVITFWGDTFKVAMVKSTDGYNFTLVSDSIISDIYSGEAGNHCVIPYQIDGYFYWFFEYLNGNWQTMLLKSQNMESGWEKVCDLPVPSNRGMLGGPKVFYQDRKFKLFYHFSPTSGTVFPTYLGYSEISIDDITYLKDIYCTTTDKGEILNIDLKPWGDTTDQIADIDLVEIDDQVYMLADYNDNTNYKFEIYIWKCDSHSIAEMLRLAK